MPRKPRPSPVILQTEDIASGRPMLGEFVDDWGEVQRMSPDAAKPSRGLPTDAQDYRDAVNRAKLAASRRVLARLEPRPGNAFKRRM